MWLQSVYSSFSGLDPEYLCFEKSKCLRLIREGKEAVKLRSRRRLIIEKIHDDADVKRRLKIEVLHFPIVIKLAVHLLVLVNNLLT